MLRSCYTSSPHSNFTEVEIVTDPTRGIYKDSKVGTRILVFGIIMFVLLVASIYVIAISIKQYPNGTFVLASLWVIGIPAYFLFEHVYLFRKYGDPEQYDQFTRLQDLAAKIWAGAILVLAALFKGEWSFK